MTNGNDIKIKRDSAETVYVSHPESSFGIFCFNSMGDLFLNSDWGFFGYAWRSYGENFKDFLKQVHAEYIVQKFKINFLSDGAKKTAWNFKQPHLLNLVQSFINELNKSE